LIRRLLLIAVLVVAAVPRLVDLDGIPPALFIDEAQNGLDAWAIRTGENFPIWVTVPENPHRGREPMFAYLMAGVMTILGPSAVAVRLTSALIGIATIGFFFALCEKLRGTSFALVAALLLSLSRWHINMSRIGFRAILVPLFIVLACLAIHALIRHERPRAAVATGIVLGAGFYTYTAWAVVLPAFLLLYVIVRVRRGPLLKRPQLWLAALVMILTLTPLTLYAASNPDQFFARAAQTSAPVARSASDLVENTQRVLFMFHFRGDQEARHNIPGQPMLDPFMGLFFAVGLYVAARRAVRGDMVALGALLLWLFALVPSAVTENAPHALRAIGTLPPICFITAMALDRLLDPGQSRRRLVRAATIAVSAALFAFIAIWNLQSHFVRWANHDEVADHFSTDIPRFYSLLDERAQGHDLFATPYLYHSPNIRFLNLSSGLDMHPIEGHAFATRGTSSRDRIIASDNEAVNLLVESLYPNAAIVGRFGTWGSSSGRIYRIPFEQLEDSLQPDEVFVAETLIETMLKSFDATKSLW